MVFLEHAYEAGDRNILDIILCPPSTQAGGATCACCQNGVREQGVWCMSYRESESRTSELPLCGACARRLTPRRFVVDLTSLESVSDTEGREISLLRERVDGIREHRGRNGSTMTLRGADAVDLAQDAAMPLTELARRLDDAGVLARY